MSVHLHTTISRKTNETLEELAKTYGTKSRVLEQALETLLRVDKVGSCDDCVIKAKMSEQMNLREALDLTSVGRKTLDSLLEVAVGDKTIEDFIKEQKDEARNIIEILRSSVSWKAPSNFKEFLAVLEEIKNITRLFEIPSYNEIDTTAIIRPKAFKRLPEIVAFKVATVLEGVEAPFDIRMMGDDIVVKMIRPEVYPLRRKEFNEFLEKQFEKRIASVTPSLFRNNLVLVGPSFMSWAEKHLEEPVTDLGPIIEDVRIALGVDELPKEPKEFVKGLLSACLKMNWFKQAKILTERENTLELVFQVTVIPLARLSVAVFSVILATRGWKLVNYSTEHTTVNMAIQYVGAEDQSLLDQLAELSLFQTIGKQFLDVVPVPRELFNSFALKVYETDRERFNDIYRATGVRISNAIRMLARNDPEKIRRLSQNFILKNINITQPDAEVRFVDDEHFTIIFKRIDPLVINSQRTLIESMFKELGYDISTTVFQNLLSFKLKLLEKPVLEPVPRKRIMQTLVDEMSTCNTVEEAFALEKEQLDELFPEDYPWTIREVGDRLIDMYRELGIEVGIEYFEGGFTLKYKSCPYYKLVKSQQKTWLCNLRKRTIEYVISRVTHGKKGKIKIIKSLLKNEHPCEYAIFLTGFLEKEEKAVQE
ncbi:MAG: hypothetical protein ACQXXH_01095 [Candidatus Bathyarchaeia archaeon]|jgi:hypothetical protein|nr:hypothetical protein [Candidatus Bathyarchaeota archaeon A05DMB-4]MDH7595950.1 hypothetical protein [Candidatus Bathyarchaeota archaeon]